MNNPTITQIRENSKARFKVIDQTSKRVITRSVSLEKQLYKRVLQRIISKLEVSDSGLILDSPANRSIIANNAFINKFLQNTAGQDIIKILNNAFGKLDKYAFEKGSLFGNVRDIKTRAQDRSRTALGYKARGKQQGQFFNQMVEDTSQYRKVLGALNLALSQQGTKRDFQRIVKTAIRGNESRLGVISNFQQVTMQSGAQTEMYDRMVQNEYSKALQLNYAIYQGGEIQTTRDFCDQRNGKVYKREEIADWNTLDWDGKKEAHNIFIDCGGYNCRHYYDWISYELAVQLRKNIGRSIYDRA